MRIPTEIHQENRVPCVSPFKVRLKVTYRVPMTSYCTYLVPLLRQTVILVKKMQFNFFYPMYLTPREGLPLSLQRFSLRCFYTVGWATGRASGQSKAGCWFVGCDHFTEASHVLNLQLSLPPLSSLSPVKSIMETFWYWLET